MPTYSHFTADLYLYHVSQVLHVLLATVTMMMMRGDDVDMWGMGNEVKNDGKVAKQLYANMLYIGRYQMVVKALKDGENGSIWYGSKLKQIGWMYKLTENFTRLLKNLANFHLWML